MHLRLLTCKEYNYLHFRYCRRWGFFFRLRLTFLKVYKKKKKGIVKRISIPLKHWRTLGSTTVKRKLRKTNLEICPPSKLIQTMPKHSSL